MTILVAPPANLPTAAGGNVLANAGRYARNAVLTAFDMMGGTQGLVEWAKRTPINEADFYTKLFPKVIQREVEVTAARTIEDVLNVIDGDFSEVTNPLPGVSAPASMANFNPSPQFAFADVDDDESETVE